MTFRTTRSQSRFRKSPDRLSPEVLISVFLRLDSQEIIIFRRVCKKWLDVIDTNKLLWRNLEWIGKSGESYKKAIDLFDEKSASSLEVVSIQDNGPLYSEEELQQVVPVISRSRANLKSLSVVTFRSSLIIGQVLELANSSPNLEKLVLWNSQEIYRKYLPVTRLVPNRKVNAGSSASSLKVLWLFSISSESITQILELPAQLVNSLISFGLFTFHEFQEIRPVLVKFSESILHLKLKIVDGVPGMQQPLFCPNLGILEGNFQSGVSLYFDCPNLKHLILRLGPGSELQSTPSSVEQLWLKSNGQDLTAELWEPLLSSCPRMEVLKLKESGSRSGTNLQPEALVQVLEKRQEIINRGEEIQGLRVVPLQKLVLCLDFLSRDQLERARKVTGEVVDLQDYPKFIELEY